MAYSVDIREVTFENKEINFQIKSGITSIKLEDVICCKVPQKKRLLSSLHQNHPYVIIQYMLSAEDVPWSVEKVKIVGETSECLSFMNQVNQLIQTDLRRPKRLVVFINPISGNHDSRSVYSKTVGPLFEDAHIECDVLVSERPKHMMELVSAYNFDRTDGVVIFGGDGTLHEVLNCILTRTQQNAGIDCNQSFLQQRKTTVPVGVIPTGTGNWYVEHLYGVQDIVTATLHIIKGCTQYQDIHGVYSGGMLVSYSAISVAHGIISDIIMYSDQQRWLRKLRFKVMPLHTVLFRKQRFIDAKITSFTKKSSVDYSVWIESPSLQQDFQNEETEGIYTSLTSFRDVFMKQGDNGTRLLIAYLIPSRLDLLKRFGFLESRGVSEVPPDFIKRYTVAGYKVTINNKDSATDSSETKLERSICVDGEIYEFDGSEYEVRHLGKLVKFFL